MNRSRMAEVAAAVLGCWTFGAVILTVIIIAFVLKSNYEKEQKKLAQKK